MRHRIGGNKRPLVWAYVACSTWLALSVLTARGQDISQREAEKRECEARLYNTWTATMHFASRRGALPASLDELLQSNENFVDRDELRCPTGLQEGVSSVGKVNRLEFLPTHRHTDFFYEFTQTPPEYYDWKRKQLLIFGSRVPLIRCLCHGDNEILNIDFSGRLFRSGLYWEKEFISESAYSSLEPIIAEESNADLLDDPRRLQAARIAAQASRYISSALDEPLALENVSTKGAFTDSRVEKITISFWLDLSSQAPTRQGPRISMILNEKIEMELQVRASPTNHLALIRREPMAQESILCRQSIHDAPRRDRLHVGIEFSLDHPPSLYIDGETNGPLASIEWNGTHTSLDKLRIAPISISSQIRDLLVIALPEPDMPEFPKALNAWTPPDLPYQALPKTIFQLGLPLKNWIDPNWTAPNADP